MLVIVESMHFDTIVILLYKPVSCILKKCSFLCLVDFDVDDVYSCQASALISYSIMMYVGTGENLAQAFFSSGLH